MIPDWDRDARLKAEEALSQWIPGGRVVKKLYASTAREPTMTPSSFHRKCDRHGPTLVLVRSADGDTFGAYTDTAFDSEGGVVGHTKTCGPDTGAFSLFGRFGALCRVGSRSTMECSPYLGPRIGYLCLRPGTISATEPFSLSSSFGGSPNFFLPDAVEVWQVEVGEAARKTAVAAMAEVARLEAEAAWEPPVSTELLRARRDATVEAQRAVEAAERKTARARCELDDLFAQLSAAQPAVLSTGDSTGASPSRVVPVAVADPAAVKEAEAGAKAADEAASAAAAMAASCKEAAAAGLRRITSADSELYSAEFAVSRPAGLGPDVSPHCPLTWTLCMCSCVCSLVGHVSASCCSAGHRLGIFQ